MSDLLALLLCLAVLAVAELVRFGVARAFRLPSARIAKLFVAPHGGPRPTRVLAIFAGSLAMYLGVALVAFGFFVVDGHPTGFVELRVKEVPEGYPATGIVKAGDWIVAVDGQRLRFSLNRAINERNGAPVRLTIRRGDATQDITLRPLGHDGHWIVGIRPDIIDRARVRDTGLAIDRGLRFPLANAYDMLADVWPEEAADPGGPLRIFDEVVYTHPLGFGTRTLALAAQLGVYLLLIVVALDLVRAVYAVTRR